MTYMIGLLYLIKYKEGKARPKLIAPKIDTAFNPSSINSEICSGVTPFVFISTKVITALKAYVPGIKGIIAATV